MLRQVLLPFSLLVLACVLDVRLAQAQLYTSGHGDIGVAYEDGSLFLHYHLGVGAVLGGVTLTSDVELAPADVLTRVANPSVPRPAGAAWDFLRTTAGSPVWILPQINSPGRPFLGIATEELEFDDWSDVSFRLTGVVSRPSATAQFALWQSGLFGPERIFDTADEALDNDFANDLLTPVVGGHDHYNFGFTEAGIYELAITFQGTHITAGLLSDSGVFTFLVGDPVAVPEPGALALLAVALVAGWQWRRRQRAPAPAESAASPIPS